MSTGSPGKFEREGFVLMVMGPCDATPVHINSSFEYQAFSFAFLELPSIAMTLSLAGHSFCSKPVSSFDLSPTTSHHLKQISRYNSSLYSVSGKENIIFCLKQLTVEAEPLQAER